MINRTVKLPEKKKIKETKEERQERIRMWPTTRTQVIPNKKKDYKPKEEINYDE